MRLETRPDPDSFFPGFRTVDAVEGESSLRLRVGGRGPALLLLHGYPQTHLIWRHVAPGLAERFTVVAADLRGYGASWKPQGSADHAAMSKRAIADELVHAMAALGHERFAIAGHDRGGRVGHRLAIDHAARVARLAVLDIAPTREMYRDTTDRFARAYWHWFFLIQPAPFPERMIGADPDAYWLKKCGSGSAGLAPFADGALEHYLSAFRDPAAIHASCEDYRAAATIDIAHDDADGGLKLACPVLALWGAKGAVHACFDVLALWRERAGDVRGEALPGGHYLAEELPGLVGGRLRAFLEA